MEIEGVFCLGTITEVAAAATKTHVNYPFDGNSEKEYIDNYRTQTIEVKDASGKLVKTIRNNVYASVPKPKKIPYPRYPKDATKPWKPILAFESRVVPAEGSKEKLFNYNQINIFQTMTPTEVKFPLDPTGSTPVSGVQPFFSESAMNTESGEMIEQVGWNVSGQPDSLNLNFNEKSSAEQFSKSISVNVRGDDKEGTIPANTFVYTSVGLPKLAPTEVTAKVQAQQKAYCEGIRKAGGMFSELVMATDYPSKIVYPPIR